MSIRLIDTTTLEMDVFMGEEPPEYAILSHTWLGKEEVSLQEYERLLISPSDSPTRQKSGFRKIVQTCDQAKANGIRYAWVDTCCIDKSSSAELNEAINSMFKWYQHAKICYAFLSDLTVGADINTELSGCRWFTRGWCLQELIAPKEVQFFDCHWNLLGTRSGLAGLLSKITRVDKDVLCDSALLYDLPVARRMSWASRRQTTPG